MRYLLTLLLVMGMMAPAYAIDPYKGTAEEIQGANYFVEQIHDSRLTGEEKFSAISENFVNEVRRRKVAENFIDWFIEGIGRAVGACPIKIADSIPSNMENADIPEFLVRQLMNIQAMKRAQDEVVGAPKAPPVLYLGIKLTGEEARRLTSSDDMINFVINHEDRVFFQVQK